METIFLITSGVLIGFVLGSFITMLSYRLPRGMSFVLPPSRCPSCNTRLGLSDLVPVFSWLLSGGKCRHCKAPIGGRYVMIEIITALLVTTAFYVIGLHYTLLPAVLIIIGIVTWCVIKLEKKF